MAQNWIYLVEFTLVETTKKLKKPCGIENIFENVNCKKSFSKLNSMKSVIKNEPEKFKLSYNFVYWKRFSCKL